MAFKWMLVAVLLAAYANCQESSTPVPILRQINRVNDDGSYTYGFEAADGTFKIETRDDKGNVKGKYGYLDETGELKVVEYTAGKEAGFSASGSHLPEPVPVVPAAVPAAAPAAAAPTRSSSVRVPVTTTAAPVTPVRAPPALPAQTFNQQPQFAPQQFNQQPQFAPQQFNQQPQFAPQQFPQQFAPQQFPQQFAPQQFPQQFAPQQFNPQAFNQQFAPQQFAPQQFNPQAFNQQFAPQSTPQQFTPQVTNSLDDSQRQNRGFSFSFSAPVNSQSSFNQQQPFPQQFAPQQFNQFPTSVSAPRFQK